MKHWWNTAGACGNTRAIFPERVAGRGPPATRCLSSGNVTPVLRKGPTFPRRPGELSQAFGHFLLDLFQVLRPDGQPDQTIADALPAFLGGTDITVRRGARV